MKFFWLCSKKSERTEEYRELLKIIHQRMDASSIMINNGNIDYLSRAIIKPYQRQLMAQAERKVLYKKLRVEVGVEQALQQLAKSLCEPSDDPIHEKIDILLARMVLGSPALQRRAEK